MKTAQDILKSHTSGMISETRIINAMKEYAIEVARESLRNASENAFTTQTYKSYDVFDFVSTVVDKQSILNDSNIPKL